MKRLAFYYSMVGFSLLMLIGTAEGKSITAHLQISAEVEPEVEGQISEEDTDLEISEDDLRKGYKQAPIGTYLSVQTNNPNGYILSVQSQDSIVFISLSITVDGNTFELSPNKSVEIHLPYHGLAREIKKLNYRFYFSPNATAGVYPWPIAIRVYPF